MSLDFPDRRKWLAIRATPAKRPHNFFHVSKWWTEIPGTRPVKYLEHSRTLRQGRNAEKRAAATNSTARMHMLANRRLRQRGIAA